MMMLETMAHRLYAWKIPILFFALCFTLWSIGSTLYMGFGSDESIYPATVHHINDKDLVELFKKHHNRHLKLEKTTTKSSIYEEIFSEEIFYDFLKDHSLQDRCMVYFNHLSMSNPDWMVDPDHDVVFNRDAYKHFDVFRDQERKEIEKKKKAAKDKGEPYSAPSGEDTRKKYDELRHTVLAGEQTLHDYIAHARIFGKCYLSSSSGTSTKDTNFVKTQRKFLKKSVKFFRTAADKVTGRLSKIKLGCTEVEDKIFPWLTYEYPIFTRWDGKASKFPGHSRGFIKNHGCFLSEYKSRLNGKGIVLTLGDDHVNDATRFLRLLRHLGNTYPVQVVYHSSLAGESREHLISAARDSFRNYPPVDLWFVDAERAIDAKYIKKFGGFANKVMATMFNSFEEMILCDADSVLLQNPSYFFSLQKFVETGTFFYKDRSTGFFRRQDDMVLFKKLLPSIEDSAIFNIPQATDFTLDNEFFRGISDYMESGVVAIDRSRHFMQPLIMSILNFYHPVIKRIYGDKELFWLALSLGGDENYAMNTHFAASIGEFTPELERHKDTGQIKSFRSKELCSNHPAHISDIDNQTLVWFNSGFRHCGNSFKKDMKWDKEFQMKTRYTNIKNLEEFKTFFKSGLKITNAIIPPLDTKYYKNVEHEPEKSWRLADYCRGYLWCAYSRIGGYRVENGVTKEDILTGHIVNFTPEQIESFEAAADVWLAGFSWD